MRLAHLFCLLFALAGISAAQDTNFPTGPQYLINTDSPIFLHSIATPTLSLSTPLPSLIVPAVEPVPEPQSPTSEVAPATLSRIYWGAPSSTEQPTESAVENVSEIEIASPQTPLVLPASIVDTGVTVMTDAQSLRQRGYGVPLGDTAAYWKAHKPHAPRVYTNTDVQRLRRSQS